MTYLLNDYGLHFTRDDLYTARKYHSDIWKARYRGDDAEDERLHDLYFSFPAGVKDALQYLCEIGEID